MFISCILFFASIFSNTTFASDTVVRDSKWELYWQDEFDDSTLGLPDPTKWNINIGPGHPSNNEQQYFTNRTRNLRVEDGKLILESHKEDFGELENFRKYTSGRVSTSDRISFLYGRIEARLKMPKGQGLWPAFWMLGENCNNWPTCGEIDIMEFLGQNSQQAHGTIHGPGYAGSGGLGNSIRVESDFSEIFHVFAVEWSPTDLKFFVDNNLYSHLTKEDVLQKGPWVFDSPQVIILNLAVGGWWPGMPDDTTPFPNRYEIDYVRVYREKNIQNAIQLQTQRAQDHLLQNLDHKGVTAGAVIASPSTFEPNYFFHWVRDASLSMKSFLTLKDTNLADQRLKTWLAFETQIQKLSTPESFGETRFRADGSLDVSPWAKPQNDGPALRAYTLTTWALRLLEKGEQEFVEKNLSQNNGPLEKDLNYTMKHWREPSFDIWEELKGANFFTQLAQYRALVKAAALYQKLNQPLYAYQLQIESAAILESLNNFWSESDHLILPNKDIVEGWMQKKQKVDVAVILGSLYFTDEEGPFALTDERVLQTLTAYQKSFGFYAINAKSSVPMLGRYPEDTYNGFNPKAEGNPWFLANTGYAQSLCRIQKIWKQQKVLQVTSRNISFLKEFTSDSLTEGDVWLESEVRFQNILKNLQSRAAQYFERILEFVGPKGEMTEQFSQHDGSPVGAQDLSWSYASFLTASAECFDN